MPPVFGLNCQSWLHMGPNLLPTSIVVRRLSGSGGCAGCQRSAPVGCLAYSIPRNSREATV